MASIAQGILTRGHDADVVSEKLSACFVERATTHYLFRTRDKAVRTLDKKRFRGNASESVENLFDKGERAIERGGYGGILIGQCAFENKYLPSLPQDSLHARRSSKKIFNACREGRKHGNPPLNNGERKSDESKRSCFTRSIYASQSYDIVDIERLFQEGD